VVRRRVGNKKVMEKVKSLFKEFGQGTVCAAVAAGLVSASLPTALFFGLFTAVALFIGAKFVDKL